jgi:tetratricopeptide (TPR) repeat protein
LGLSYIAVGEYDKGEALAKAVFAKKQMDKSFMNDVGYAYYGVRRYDDAIRWWDQILTIDKNNAKALYMIGMAFRKKGDDEKGSRLCDAAIALDPNLAGYKKQMMPPQGMGL